MLVVGEKEELANFDKLINFEQSNEQVVFYRFNQKQNIMNNFSKDTLTETAEKELAQKEAAEEEAQVIADNQTGDAKSQTVIEYKTQQRVILDPIIGPMAIDNQTIADSLKEIQKMSQLTIEAELPNPDRRISLFTPKLRVSECLGLICEAANLEMIRTETGFKVGKTMPADLATGVFALPPSLKDKSPEEIMKQLGVNSPKLRLIKLSDKLIIQGDQKSLTAISSKLLLDSKK